MAFVESREGGHDAALPLAGSRRMQRVREVLSAGLCLAYWAVFGLLMTAAGTLLHLLLPRATGCRLGQACLRGLFRRFVTLLGWLRLVDADLSGLHALEYSDGPMIVAPNHTSLWDAVFLIACLPRCVCVMKRSILCNPFLGGGARLAGYIPNSRHTQMIRDAAAALHDNHQLLLFPEGTRTRPDVRWINPLKGGVAMVAARSGAPVVPVFIRSNTRYLEKGWPLWRRPRFPIRLCFTAGEPLRPGPDESHQEFTCRMQRLFEEELARPHPLRRRPAAIL